MLNFGGACFFFEFISLLLLMVSKSGDHQLRLVVYPIIYQVSCIPDGAGFLPSRVVRKFSLESTYNCLSSRMNQKKSEFQEVALRQ